MSDLTDRLHRYTGDTFMPTDYADAMLEAADAIDALTTERDQLRERIAGLEHVCQDYQTNAASDTARIAELERERDALRSELAEARTRITHLERLVIDACYTLEKARMWDGMDWYYNPLHPVHYKPMRDKLNDECAAIDAAMQWKG